MISHHNLAELALAMGRQGDATDHYRSAFDGLLALAGKQSAPQGLRQSCAAHLQAATVALAHHLQFCGAPARTIAKEITRARNTVLGPRGRPC
ncbi:hypothetical protein ACFQFQ_03835 [Sulfitobacter porphyrae]|uniref:Uncharacterized protein n=1 Tax=Sulfitobacter porphyrae TaxID=1246864 RepID=A0ABW2B1G0_9RHOB